MEKELCWDDIDQARVYPWHALYLVRFLVVACIFTQVFTMKLLLAQESFAPLILASISVLGIFYGVWCYVNTYFCILAPSDYVLIVDGKSLVMPGGYVQYGGLFSGPTIQCVNKTLHFGRLKIRLENEKGFVEISYEGEVEIQRPFSLEVCPSNEALEYYMKKEFDLRLQGIFESYEDAPLQDVLKVIRGEGQYHFKNVFGQDIMTDKGPKYFFGVPGYGDAFLSRNMHFTLTGIFPKTFSAT